VRIAPYRTVQNVIDGVVITFLDVTDLKRAEAELTKANELAEGIVATVREPLVVLDTGLRVVTASRAFHEVFSTEAADIRGEPLAGGGRQHWGDPGLEKLLQGVVAGEGPFDDFAVNVDIPGKGPRRFLLNARLIRSPIGNQGAKVSTATGDEQILLAIEDITDRSAIGKGDG
jgi:two-component system CheB/CheR fusion protein